jgi:hypothetical protein
MKFFINVQLKKFGFVNETLQLIKKFLIEDISNYLIIITLIPEKN